MENTAKAVMDRSYLIQRLRKPPIEETKLTALSDAFSFGGGLRNGGLSQQGFDLIKKVFRFDYMGSAEYEFGAVPKAMGTIFENRADYIAFQFECPWKYKVWNKKQKDVEHTGHTTVYVICRKEWKEEVEKRIKECAESQYGSKQKENPNVSEALSGLSEWKCDVVGWLELDNGYFFFSDQRMFTQTAELFDIK